LFKQLLRVGNDVDDQNNQILTISQLKRVNELSMLNCNLFKDVFLFILFVFLKQWHRANFVLRRY